MRTPFTWRFVYSCQGTSKVRSRTEKFCCAPATQCCNPSTSSFSEATSHIVSTVIASIITAPVVIAPIVIVVLPLVIRLVLILSTGIRRSYPHRNSLLTFDIISPMSMPPNNPPPRPSAACTIGSNPTAKAFTHPSPRTHTLSLRLLRIHRLLHIPTTSISLLRVAATVTLLLRIPTVPLLLGISLSVPLRLIHLPRELAEQPA